MTLPVEQFLKISGPNFVHGRVFYTVNFVKTTLLILLVLLFAFGSPADAASHDSKVESGALFHDQGPVFVSTNEPSITAPVVVRLRAAKNDLTAATLEYFDSKDRSLHKVPMTKEIAQSNSTFEFWSGTIPASSARKHYRFCAQDGQIRVWYNAHGVSQHGMNGSESSDGDFYVIPGFKTPDWLKNGVIYQIFPDRFCNGDTGNDVATGQYKYRSASTLQRQWGESPLTTDGDERSFTFYGGDLLGVVKKLDYIRTTLGANIVYLNPIFKAPSNHKYDTADYDVVDPAFGSNATLVSLSTALHKNLNGRRGYLLLDGVFNHTGDGHKWFGKYDPLPGVVGAYQSQKSPYFSYYNFKKWPTDYAHFMVYDSLPKLNFGSAQLRNAIYRSPNSVALKYLKPPYNIDGWRLDAPKYADANGQDGSDKFNHMIWRQFRAAVKSVKPEAAILGENWENARSWIVGGDQWDSVTNFNAFTAPVSQWITGKKIDDSPGALSTSEFEKMLRLTRAEYPSNVQQVLSNHLSNHDISRFAQRAGGDIGKTSLALIFQMTYVGTPTIYYGDEYGMMGGGDPDCRRTFDWSKIAPDNSTVALTHKLISIRNRYRALRTGSFITLKVDDDKSVFVFGRFDKQNRIAVVLNNSSSDKSVAVPLNRLDIPDGAVVKDVLNGTIYQVHSGNISITVPGHYGAILVH
ncbi:MAG: glycoside hydrolase family 13 protein [Candidatus Obscuribacterales bacterium]